MKIMYLSATAGGVLKYIRLLAKKIEENNAKMEKLGKSENKIEQIAVFSTNHKDMVEKDLDFLNKKIYLNMQSGRKLSDNIALIKSLRKVVEEESPDIIYINGSRISYVSRIALKKFKNIKIVFNSHGWNLKNGFNKFFEKHFAKYTDVNINNSDKELKLATENKIVPKVENIKINNGINFKKYEKFHKDENLKNDIRTKIRKELEIDEFQKAVVHLGNINDKKDPFIFLNACLAIIKMGYNIKIVMIGDGESDIIKKIMEFAEENNILDKIIITGWVDNLPEYLISMDIAVSTIKEEDTPVVLAEYMAAKLPIVANNSDINGEILDYGKFGKIAEAGDIEDYVLKIQEIFIENKKKNKGIESAYRYAYSNFNIDSLVKKHLAVFNILYEER